MATDVPDVLVLPARAGGLLARRLEPMLLSEASDPNAKRMSLVVVYGVALNASVIRAA